MGKRACTESFPFDEDTLVFKVGNKIFAIIVLDNEDQISLKSDPDYALELRASRPEYVLPPRYLSQKHWNLIKIKGFDDDELLMKLIDHSYDLVFNKLPQKTKSLIAI